MRGTNSWARYIIVSVLIPKIISSRLPFLSNLSVYVLLKALLGVATIYLELSVNYLKTNAIFH